MLCSNFQSRGSVQFFVLAFKRFTQNFLILVLHYIGCYNDASPRALANVHIRVERALGCSIEQCIKKCKDLNYTYAGLQYIDHCFCGNSYDKYGAANETTCSSPCNDGTNRKCGGPWRNSVYRAGITFCNHLKTVLIFYLHLLLSGEVRGPACPTQ